MDAAAIEKAFLVATKAGSLGPPACYHLPYSLVADAVRRHPDRFYGLAGIDPTQGMKGVRELQAAVEDLGFVGAHSYPHWFEIPPDGPQYYPFYAKCVELDIPIQLQVGQSLVYAPDYPRPQRGPSRHLRCGGLPLSRTPAHRHPSRHSVDRRDDCDGLEAPERLHRHGRSQPEILAAAVHSVRQYLRPRKK